ncbi:MAG: PD-(D/E)XK nuclease family protein, partial [Acidimicrobiia bacterium]
PGLSEDADRAVRSLLLGPLFGLPLGRERDLLRQRRRTRRSWSDLLSERLPGGAALAGLLADPRWVDEQPAVIGFWHLWSTLPQLVPLVADPELADFRAAWASFAQALARQWERDPTLTLAGYLALADDEDFEANPLLSYRDLAGDRLTLTTLHQAKGLEFEVVFIADALESVFPDLRRSRSLLQPGLLSPHQPDHPAATVWFRLQEEMRLAYMAMTRARRRVVWTATQAGLDESERRPSRFLLAVTGTTGFDELGPPPERAGHPVTYLEAEAHLRRILLDPAEPAGRRLGAAQVLACRPNPGLRPASDFAFVRRPGPDTGLLPSRTRLSPSQADSYQACPRRYALERRLEVGEEASSYLTFGSLIHEVLERTERDAIHRGEAHGTLEAALRILDLVWEGADFGGPAYDAAWRRRAETLLTALYGEWIRPGARGMAVELPLQAEIGGVAWRGRCDRLEEIRPGRLRIVDYKTGKRMPTFAEAGESIQLGFYLLTASRDPELAALGSPVEAEFWFPLAEAKKRWRAFDPANLATLEDRLTEVAISIQAEDWAPKVGSHCGRCRVKLVCPMWPEGREAYGR